MWENFRGTCSFCPLNKYKLNKLMQLVIKEIMDLSVRKNSNGPVDRTSQIQASSDKSSSVTVKRGAKLSFSVDRLLKSPELKHQNTNPQEKPVKDEINSAALLPGALSSACLTPPLPIRPLVSQYFPTTFNYMKKYSVYNDTSRAIKAVKDG